MILRRVNEQSHRGASTEPIWGRANLCSRLPNGKIGIAIYAPPSYNYGVGDAAMVGVVAEVLTIVVFEGITELNKMLAKNRINNNPPKTQKKQPVGLNFIEVFVAFNAVPPL